MIRTEFLNIRDFITWGKNHVKHRSLQAISNRSEDRQKVSLMILDNIFRFLMIAHVKTKVVWSNQKRY